MSTDDPKRCAFCDRPLSDADNWRSHSEFVTCIMNLRDDREALQLELLERCITVEPEER